MQRLAIVAPASKLFGYNVVVVFGKDSESPKKFAGLFSDDLFRHVVHGDYHGLFVFI